MYHNRAVIRQWLLVSAWILGLTALMLVVYAIIDMFTPKVLLGAVIGAVISSLNFLFLTMAVTRAADRAEETGEAAKAKASIQSSTLGRMMALLAIYAVLFKLEVCDPIASLLPLVFVQLSITVMEFFRKDGKKQ